MRSYNLRQGFTDIRMPYRNWTSTFNTVSKINSCRHTLRLPKSFGMFMICQSQIFNDAENFKVFVLLLCNSSIFSLVVFQFATIRHSQRLPFFLLRQYICWKRIKNFYHTVQMKFHTFIDYVKNQTSSEILCFSVIWIFYHRPTSHLRLDKNFK